jgi:hypothetical protein
MKATGFLTAALFWAGCTDGAPSRQTDRLIGPAPTAASAAPAPATAPMPKLHGANWESEVGEAAPPPATSQAMKWRDPGVYVDGVPVGVVSFLELPRRLEPTWIEGVELLDFKPGDKGPRERTIKYRRYNVADYLEALGVDLARVKRLDVHGGGTYVAAVSGDDLRRYREGIQFDFSRETEGKVRIYFPDGVAVNTVFDRMVGFSVYVDKTPPEVTDQDVLALDGKPVVGVPYFGSPLRGGIRVYVDDRLATTIKRNQLDPTQTSWSLFGFLAGKGIDTAKLTTAELIYNGKRDVRLSRHELETASFAASSNARGEVTVAEHGANAIMLYTKPLRTARR